MSNRSTLPVLDSGSNEKRTWSVGTLTYNPRQLGNVFFWMLWGDFCLMLMDAGVGPNLVTLQLAKNGASDASIGFLQGTVVQFFSIALVAPISTWSDRLRTRLGRRMPFMLFSTPFISLSLILLGFSSNIGGWLQHVAPRVFGGVAIASLTVGVIAVTNTLYKFFDLFPQSVYYYLFTDVIPHELMGRFTSLIRVCSTLGSMVFNLFLLGYCRDHPGAICIGAAALYLVTFVLLCFIVKEGKYPPPEPREDRGASRVIEDIVVYARECFSLGYYWKIYFCWLCFMVGLGPIRVFLIRYATEDLKIPLATFGRIMSVRDFLQIPIFLAMGPIVDRIHPLRAGFIGFVMMTVSALTGFVCIVGTKSFTACVIFLFVSVAVYQGVLLAMGPRLFPRDKYGQFCSANSIVFSTGLMIGMWACGKLLDRMGSHRYAFLWTFCFALVGCLMISLVYRDWKRLGGDEHYEPPLKGQTAEPRGFEVIHGESKSGQ